MKNIKIYLTMFLLAALLPSSFCQTIVSDKSIRYQQERMVFKQWDRKKFTPTSGFLGLNPWYWLTWGFFYPNYQKKDLRPLSGSGPQTQRLGLVAAMSNTDNNYKLQSDTLRSSALSELAGHSGLLSIADPLWQLYYSREFRAVLNNSMASILDGLSPQVSSKLIAEGIYSWYKNELDRLKERIEGARSADMERGARIMAYYRLLREYRELAGIWAIRTSAAQSTLDMTAQQERLKYNRVTAPEWTPQVDVQIARQVLQRMK